MSDRPLRVHLYDYDLYIVYYVQFTIDFLVELVRKDVHMADWGLGRRMRFCNPDNTKGSVLY
jgi:hypothetical protein